MNHKTANLLGTVIAWIILCICVLMIIGGIVLAERGIEKVKCDARWEGVRHEFTLLGGCRVEYMGKLVPADNVRFGGE